MKIPKIVHHVAHSSEKAIDAIISPMRQERVREGQVYIETFDGFGTPTHVQAGGRVLLGEPIAHAERHDTALDNFVSMIKRYASQEVEGVLVRATFGGQTKEVCSDEEGYVNFEFALHAPLPKRFWHIMTLEIVEPELPSHKINHYDLKVQVPLSNTLGVISDIDDTIVETNADHLLEHTMTVLFNNARTRDAFTGVPELYRAMCNDDRGQRAHPIWYVSSSPWNLYDLFEEFMHDNKMPLGTMMLKDFGTDETKLIKSPHDHHKIACIERILATYPDMRFILIGDTGQADPEIYTHVVENHPTRFHAVYLRDVTGDARLEEIKPLIVSLGAIGVPMVVAHDSGVIARHAAELGLIAPEVAHQVSAQIVESVSEEAEVA